MRFTWDESKRQRPLQRRGLDFAQVAQVFAGPTFTFEDDRQNYGQQRWVTMGLLNADVVVHTETVDEIRVISMRKAEKD